jgi:DNA helicase-2/ATP-dependent DNA helicase PcrA
MTLWGHSLVADTDVWDPQENRVSLMTLHAAKGLEFPVVYLVALEDGILPHERSLDHPDQLEEERRLVFVGITRGREEVHASASRLRDYRGSRRISAPSLFLTEMNGSETVVIGAEAPTFEPSWRGGGSDGHDEYSQVAPGHADDAGIDDAADVRTATSRPDGLVLELDEGIPAGRPAKPKRTAAALERVIDFATRLGEGGPRKHDYRQGQRVRHAEHGEGVIAAISGVGPRAVGTVIFDGPAGTRKFILGHGSLEPLE